jgi:hypothetical protein
MRRHLYEEDVLLRLVRSRRFSWNDDPEYLKKFKERLAVAAMDLKAFLDHSLDDIGVLYDKMFYTGTIDDKVQRSVLSNISKSLKDVKHATKGSEDAGSSGKVVIGRGQVSCLTCMCFLI